MLFVEGFLNKEGKKAVEPFMAFLLKAPYSFMCPLCHSIAIFSSLFSFPHPASPGILLPMVNSGCAKGKTENICPWQIYCFQCSGKNNGREEDWHKLASWMIIIMKFNRQSKSDSYFWHVVDSWGKANEEQSADPAVCYVVMPNYCPQLIFWQNKEESCCNFWQRQKLIKPNEGVNSDNSCSFFWRSFSTSAISLHNQSKSLQYWCFLQQGRNTFTCHIDENTWDFPQIEEDTERQSAGRSYQENHNLDLWGKCKRRHPRFF